MNKVLSSIEHYAFTQPSQIALVSISGYEFTYSHLYQLIKHISTELVEITGFNSRIAIILPGDEKSAIAFLSVISCGVAAPINPKLTVDEFAKLFNLLNIQCVLTSNTGEFKHVINAANENQIKHVFWEDIYPNNIIENSPVIDSRSANTPVLLLHTSGTTAAPKIVPLSADNISISASNIANTLQLETNDRCLNVMPLFHIHGLMAGLCASLIAGASVICSPGYHGIHFFDWLSAYKPTWYTAVPTIHQAVLERGKQNPQLIENHSLRFIRSSSSSLSPNTFHEIEALFYIPIIEAYGMTEATHQIASNPLPPMQRKPGFVGKPAGPEIAIADPGNPILLAANLTGEIVIRGENVITGYENNPEANQKNFFNGWFRTGDEGTFDNDGYLRISGRIKEIINRGGEKITPREIDEVLLNHPSIKQAVCFAIPHPQYGEVVGAAVISEDTSLTSENIQTYLHDKLADYKIPALIQIVDKIPTGPTGKIQRVFLAKALNIDTFFFQRNTDSSTNHATDQQKKDMLDIWCQVLELDTCPEDTAFLELGGDSLLAAELVLRINTKFKTRIKIIDLFEYNTINKLLKKISS
jgi:acyl-CoA synthetase (AMP-forming)/AMP-acid ligase II/acyl carrier protein